MDKVISLEAAIKALTGWETDPTDEEIEYTLRKLATDKNVGTNDTINRQQAIDALKELTANGTNKGMVFGEDAVHRIEMLPSAQPEQCTGKWILGDMCSVKGYWATCSVCGHTSFGGGNFCRECGAKMEGDAERPSENF